MGSCASKKAKKQNPGPFINQNVAQDRAIIFPEENFKVVDYTRRLEGISHLNDVKYFQKVNEKFPGYAPIEVRCVKGDEENINNHSHLMIVFSLNNDMKTKEIGLITDYSLYGFSITIGEMELLREICKLKKSKLEFLLLPKADNVHNITIADVLEWAFYHKDEEYKDPQKIPECNMGKRIFKYISDKLSDNFGSRNRV